MTGRAATVIPFRGRGRRHVAHAGDWRGAGPGDRGRRRGARVFLWPHRWRPRQPERIDTAVAWTWDQHARGDISDVEAHARIIELHALRVSLAKAREGGRPA
jgi:hypothetical protein